MQHLRGDKSELQYKQLQNQQVCIKRQAILKLETDLIFST